MGHLASCSAILSHSGDFETFSAFLVLFWAILGPKEDERVGRGHFHERGDESPARFGRFHCAFSMEHFSCEFIYELDISKKDLAKA